MKITMNDGASNRLLDLDTMGAERWHLSISAMRYHIFDPETNTATVKFNTRDRKLQDRILRAMVMLFGHECRASGWIRVKTRRQELLPPEDFAGMDLTRMATRDLSKYWGESVKITGIAVRDIRYTSDGSLDATPDAIGMFGDSPIVYLGKAVGTTFTINGEDVMYSDNNVAYWLPEPWWHGFHARYRNVPKSFPWPCGFVASNWCMRYGHNNYGSDIYIASMTQGQTLGSWSQTTFLEKGINVDGVRLVTSSGHIGSKEALKNRVRLIRASSYAPLKRIGTICTYCCKQLTLAYGLCDNCGKSNTTYNYEVAVGQMGCLTCGCMAERCECGAQEHLMELNTLDHQAQYKNLTNYIHLIDSAIVTEQLHAH